MIKIGKLTDYAVVVLAQLARDSSDKLYSSAVLAEDTGISEATVAKVLKILARSGLVKSHRGAFGGYTMVANPSDVTALHVIEAMEGPVSLTSWASGIGGSCASDDECPVRGSWDGVNTAVRKALSNLTLQDLTEGCGYQCASIGQNLNKLNKMIGA